MGERCWDRIRDTWTGRDSGRNIYGTGAAPTVAVIVVVRSSSSSNIELLIVVVVVRSSRKR